MNTPCLLSATESVTISIIIPIRGENHVLLEVFAVVSDILDDYNAELILVFNGPAPSQIPSGNPDRIRILHVSSPISPYTARNRGVAIARGTHVVFLDATCVPGSGWLDAGLAQLQAGNDVIAGRVEFCFAGAKPTAAELWDSVINVQQKRAVARGTAKTGNLFVSRRALETLGPFREGVRSGEDVRWTGQAVGFGLRLSYCRDAVVYYRARKLKPLLRKALRVGTGQAALFPLWNKVIRIAAMMVLPPSPSRVQRALKRAGNEARNPWLVMRIIAVAWCVQISQGIGLMLPGLFRQVD